MLAVKRACDACTPGKPSTTGSQQQASNAAVLERFKSTLQLLVQASPETLNMHDTSGETPIMAALSSGNLLVAQLLLSLGAKASVGSYLATNRTPLHVACALKPMALMAAGYKPADITSLLDAIFAQPLALAARDAAAQPGRVATAAATCPTTTTISSAVSSGGAPSSVAAVASSSASSLIMAKDYNGRTPLHDAALALNLPAVVRILTALNRERSRALMSSSTAAAAIATVAPLPADLLLHDSEGNTPLMYALRSGLAAPPSPPGSAGAAFVNGTAAGEVAAALLTDPAAACVAVCEMLVCHCPGLLNVNSDNSNPRKPLEVLTAATGAAAGAAGGAAGGGRTTAVPHVEALAAVSALRAVQKKYLVKPHMACHEGAQRHHGHRRALLLDVCVLQSYCGCCVSYIIPVCGIGSACCKKQIVADVRRSRKCFSIDASNNTSMQCRRRCRNV